MCKLTSLQLADKEPGKCGADGHRAQLTFVIRSCITTTAPNNLSACETQFDTPATGFDEMKHAIPLPMPT